MFVRGLTTVLVCTDSFAVGLSVVSVLASFIETTDTHRGTRAR